MQKTFFLIWKRRKG